MRDAFAQEMTRLAAERTDLTLLSGDIGNRMFDRYKQVAPERFFNCGIAEANVMSLAAGMALSGLRPVIYTIAPFTTTRCRSPAAMLAGAIVFHGVAQPKPVAAPVVDQAAFERRISEEVAKALPAVLEKAEQRHRTQLASAIKEAEGKYERLRREDQMNMEASYSLFREKQAAMMVSYAQNSGGGAQ